MTQLSRTEIIELRARAIWRAEIDGGSAYPFEELTDYAKKGYIAQAISTIKADESAGVLLLAEEDKEGLLPCLNCGSANLSHDYPTPDSYVHCLECGLNNAGSRHWNKRLATPVYQCKKD